MSRFGKQLTAGAVALGVFFVAAVGCQAQTVLTNYYWTGLNGDGVWEEAGNWVLSNSVAATAYPGQNGGAYDSALFTNVGTYSVTINAGDVIIVQSNIFNNGSNSLATVTLTIPTNTIFNPAASGTDFIVGDDATATSVVYLASCYGGSSGLLGLQVSTLNVGHAGVGTLIVTNGYVSSTAKDVNLGTDKGCGTIIVSGPNTYWAGYQISIGNTNASYGNTVIVSNSASFTMTSTFRVGSSSSQGSSNNALIVTDGAFVNDMAGEPLTVGNRSTLTGTVANNNYLDVKNGGVLSCFGQAKEHSLVVGVAAVDLTGVPCSGCAATAAGLSGTGNVFTVEATGTATGFSQVCITPTNTMNLYGGVMAGNISNYGVFEGWGVIIGSLHTGSNTLTGAFGFSAISNQAGALVCSNSFTTATNTIVQIALGTSYSPIQVGLGQYTPTNYNGGTPFLTNSIEMYGNLNFVDSGGFTTGTYALITYPASLIATNPVGGGLTNNNIFIVAPKIGSVPNPAYTYAINTNTLGEIDLIVGCTNCGAPPVGCFAVTTPVALEACVSDCSTGSPVITTWNWYWGDGNSTLALSNPPCHTYASAGNYVITQIVVNASGSATNAQGVTVYTPFQGWQNQYFSGGSINAQAAAGKDVYGTGMSNTNKFLTGFAGNSASAYLHIISIAKQSGAATNVVVTYLGASGDSTYQPGVAMRTNVLEYTTGTANGSYSTNSFASTGQTNILSGGTGLGTQASMIDTNGAGAGNTTRYYRVRVLLP
jgi:PKD repeat protein